MKELSEGDEREDGRLKETDDVQSRRQFFTGLGRWSKIVIGVALLGLGASSEVAHAADRPYRSGGRLPMGDFPSLDWKIRPRIRQPRKKELERKVAPPKGGGSPVEPQKTPPQ